MISQLNTLVSDVSERKEKGSEKSTAPLGKGGVYTNPTSTTEKSSLSMDEKTLSEHQQKERDSNTQCVFSLLGLMIEVAQDRSYLRSLADKLSMSLLRRLVGFVGVRACEPLLTRIMGVAQVGERMNE